MSLAPLQKWPKICQDPGVIRPVAASVPRLRECPADSCGQCQSNLGHVAGLLRADPTGCPITGLGTTPRALQPAPRPSPQLGRILGPALPGFRPGLHHPLKV